MAKAGAKFLTDPRLSDTAVFCGGLALLAVIVVLQLNERFSLHTWLMTAGAIAVGLLISFFLIVFQFHPYRRLGLIPWHLTLTTIFFFIEVVEKRFDDSCLYIVMTGCVIGLSMCLHYSLSVRKLTRRAWNTVRPKPSTFSVAIGSMFVVMAISLAGFGWLYELPAYFELSPHSSKWMICLLSSGLMIWSWCRLARPAIETIFDFTTTIMYRIRGHGSGKMTLPPVGPALVIANHAAFLDPIILHRVINRPLTGMMTSVYFDKWFLRPLAVWIFHVIRVPHALVRHEAPELSEAVKALDRGECVLIFPEAWLRRKDEQPLKRFGQGVWQILKERPETPVVACWIEGTWGSYFSHQNGPPMTGKPFDFRRPIDIGISSPITVPTTVLADHWDTRFFLMNCVSEARQHIGLEALPEFQRNQNVHDE